MAIQIRSRGPAAAQARFTASVQAIFPAIRRTHTGRLILEWLNRAPYDTIIEPYSGHDYNNADEIGASESHAGNDRLGTSARGTRAFVGFSPNNLSGHGVGNRPDEVLLHELCHGLRSVYGWERYDHAGNYLRMAGGFDDVEEFFAIMVTSVHSSELGRGARGDHGNWRLPSEDLLRKHPYDTRLRQFNTSMPVLCSQLRGIPANVAPFNPFRDIAAP